MKTMRPMLSFIVPVYNGEKYLAEAIYSLLQQPCQDMEVIIVDDGSTDSSGSIADAIAAENRNIRVCHIPNRGVSAARNVGIQLASGRYIGFLDADDLLCKDAYTWEIHEILAAAQYDILSFSYLLAMDDLRFGRMIQVNTPGLFERDHPQYHLQTQKHFCSFLYRRELFTNVIRFPDGIRYFEDVGFLFLISRNAENIMQYEKAWFLHRMNYTSVIHSINDADYILEVLEMWNWCRHNSILPDDIHTCDGNIFSLMADRKSVV